MSPEGLILVGIGQISDIFFEVMKVWSTFCQIFAKISPKEQAKTSKKMILCISYIGGYDSMNGSSTLHYHIK